MEAPLLDLPLLKGEEKRGGQYSVKDSGDERVHFNSEHHIMLENAKKIKKGVELNDEIIFPLEAKDDYGRIAAQTAKQVIIQKIREAERTSVIDEYGGKEGEVVSGVVQKVERGRCFRGFQPRDRHLARRGTNPWRILGTRSKIARVSILGGRPAARNQFAIVAHSSEIYRKTFRAGSAGNRKRSGGN